MAYSFVEDYVLQAASITGTSARPRSDGGLSKPGSQGKCLRLQSTTEVLVASDGYSSKMEVMSRSQGKQWRMAIAC